MIGKIGRVDVPLVLYTRAPIVEASSKLYKIRAKLDVAGLSRRLPPFENAMKAETFLFSPFTSTSPEIASPHGSCDIWKCRGGNKSAVQWGPSGLCLCGIFN